MINTVVTKLHVASLELHVKIFQNARTFTEVRS
jgi:hypothetical protein